MLKSIRTKILTFSIFISLAVNALAADEIDVVSSASNYLVKYLIGIAIVILPLQTIFQLIQVKFGKKDIGEAMVPIGWTTLIVATPTIIAVIVDLITPFLGDNAL